jgi:hypothetical protein
MATMRDDQRAHTEGTSQTIKRRGLLAAAWAAVAAFVLRQTTQPLQAGVDGDVVLGFPNASTFETSITNSANNGTAFFAQCINGPSGVGLEAKGSKYGVIGTNVQPNFPGAGILGLTIDAKSYGVWGLHEGPTGTAVQGDATIAPGGTGVAGIVTSGIGVSGQVPATSSANAIAVYGQNYSTYTGPGPGAGGFGVYGLSAKGHGLVGAVATAGAAAVVGAVNGVAGAYAGAFYGPVIVSGAFTVLGPKSAAVAHPDGTHRRLYCIESPESWFEDFGKGQLECGRAEVTIDPGFAAVVDLTDYQVFLTQYGSYDVLSVTAQTPQGFRVETQNTTSASRFGWRIVAKRKDIPAPRFETVTVPPEPVLPSIPEPVVPNPPPIHDIRQPSRQQHR